jgi:formate dehydrogenase subunit delta
MDIDNLVHMANRMGEFFQAMPDVKQGQLDLSQHIRKFWAPRMRNALNAHIESTGGQDLQPFVRSALIANKTAWL